MSKEDTLSLQDLNLKIGQVVQLHPSSDNVQERYDCTLIGCLPLESVIVTAPASGIFPQLSEGQQVVIRVMSANGVALFPTTVLYISDVPAFMVYLDFPKSIKFKLVRSASRVDVALPVLASNLVARQFGNIPGKLTDISIGGARAEFFSEIGKVGEGVELKGKFQIAKIQRTMSIRAVICSVSTLENNHHSCGLSFDEGDEDKLLILFGFIFNAMAFGSVQQVR